MKGPFLGAVDPARGGDCRSGITELEHPSRAAMPQLLERIEKLP